MSISFERVSKRVFSIVKGGGRTVTLFDEVGNKIYNPEKARRFFVEPEHIMVTVNEGEKELKVFLHEGVDIEQIERFLTSLRKTAVHYCLKYTTRKFGRRITPKDFAYQAEIEKERMKEAQGGNMEAVMEKMGGYKKTSYQKIGDCRLVVRHTEPVDEKKIGARGRNIDAVFVENSLGERFRMPFAHLNGGRAMARHLAEGGTLDDEIGVRIKGLMTEWSNLRGVARYMSENMKVIGVNDNTHSCRDLIRDRIVEINSVFKQMMGSRGYSTSRESLLEDDDLDGTQIASECDKITSHLCLDEGNEAFLDGINAMARHALRKQALESDEPTIEPVVEEEPTVGDAIEEFSEFNEWLNSFNVDTILRENEEPATDTETETENDDIFFEGDSVSVVPTPAINSSAFPEANWIKKPTSVKLRGKVERGTTDVVECELDDGSVKKCYGFNISGEKKEDPDSIKVKVKESDTIWEAAARLVKWHSHPDKVRELAEGIKPADLTKVLETIGSVWMPYVADSIRSIIEEGSVDRKSIEDEWEELVESVTEDTRPTAISFKSPADMIVSTRRLEQKKINFDSDYADLLITFESADDCVAAARILKENKIRFNEDVFGGDMGEDFLRGVSSTYNRENPEPDTTPHFTGFPYKVPEHDVETLINALDDAGIEFSMDGNVFHFEDEETRERAMDLHHPNDIDRGIVGEMADLRNKVIRLSDYRK